MLLTIRLILLIPYGNYCPCLMVNTEECNCFSQQCVEIRVLLRLGKMAKLPRFSAKYFSSEIRLSDFIVSFMHRIYQIFLKLVSDYYQFYDKMCSLSRLISAVYGLKKLKEKN